MKILAKIAGGSHLYGLNTPQSDYDERYIYAYDDVANIVGLDKNECIDNRVGDEDKLGYELRRFLQLLRKTNTQVVELLFADEDKFIELTPEFKRIRENKFKLIDQDKFYKSMRGYIQGELRLANGERTGDLGGKRKAALEKYGFSPKNFCQLIRLCKCGITYFRDGEYPVDLRKRFPDLSKELLLIKTQPELFTKQHLNEIVHAMEIDLVAAYTLREGQPPVSYYDHDLANRIIFETYYPTLKEIYEKNSNV
jgi:hypothetical protein